MLLYEAPVPPPPPPVPALLLQEVVQILLNPSKVVTGKCAIVDSMKLLLTQEDAKGSACSVCNASGGLIVRCVEQRCHKLMHVNCASKPVASRRYSGNHFYRCPSCSPSEISDDEERKRGPSRGAGKGCQKKQKGAARSKPALQESVPSSAPGPIIVAFAADSNCSSLKSPEARQPATSADAVTLFSSDTPGGSCAFNTGHLDDLNFDADLRAAADCPGTFCSDHDALSHACQELFFIRSDSENLRVALQAAHETVSSNVSVPNAVQVRTVLEQIRSGLRTLARFVQQFQTTYQVPSIEFPPSFGGGVAASNDVLSDALLDIDTFEIDMEMLNRQFESTLAAVELRAKLQRAKSSASPLVSPGVDSSATDAAAVLASGSSQKSSSATVPSTDRQSPASDFFRRVDSSATGAAAVLASGSSQKSSSATVPSTDRMQTPFLTVSAEMNIASYLNSRLQCEFQECTNCEGRLISLQPHEVDSKIWTKPHHFVGSQYVVKVYRILWDSTDSKRKGQCRLLAQALHECAATAFVCQKEGWYFDLFGVVNQETHSCAHLHICLLRTRLDPKVLGANDAATAGVQLLKRTGVVHGDCHEGNLKRRINDAVIELLDFERSFFLGKNDETAMIESIKTYAEDAQSRKQLLQKMQSQGMDDTRQRFILFSHRLDNVFDITMNVILTVFTNA